jgi:excisionase family DNA binding protein
MKLLTAAEVRGILRVDQKTLIKLIKSGALPALKAGVGQNAPYRISENALNDYIKRETAKTAQPAS